MGNVFFVKKRRGKVNERDELIEKKNHYDFLQWQKENIREITGKESIYVHPSSRMAKDDSNVSEENKKC